MDEAIVHQGRMKAEALGIALRNTFIGARIYD